MDSTLIAILLMLALDVLCICVGMELCIMWAFPKIVAGATKPTDILKSYSSILIAVFALYSTVVDICKLINYFRG